MGNFEKLSVLVIVVIIVMILVVAIYTWQENPAGPETAGADTTNQPLNKPTDNPWGPDSNGGERADPLPDGRVPPAVDPVPPNVDVPPIDVPVPGPEDPQGRIADNIDPEVDNEPWIHEVQGGEVLGVIAQKYLGSTRRMNEIISMNPGMDADHLTIGQKIKMPARGTPRIGPDPVRGGPVVGPGPARGGEGSRPTAGSTYTTRRGDRLDTIAKLAYGNVERWPELFAINKEKVTNPFRLDEGVQLKLPR